MPSRKQLYRLWLGLGIAAFLHGIVTGGGLAGALLSWELEKFEAVRPTATNALLSIPLVFAPLLLIAADAEVQRLQHCSRVLLVIGSMLLITASLAFWRTCFLPDPHAPPLQIILDDLSTTAPEEHRSVLVGTPRPEYMLAYDEVVSGRFRTATYGHRIFPITTSNWTPDKPVRFLVDTRGTSVENALRQVPGSQRYATGRGLLLSNRLPAYVLASLKRKGLVIANDVMVHTTDPYAGRDVCYIFAALSAISAVFCFAIGVGTRLAAKRCGRIQ